jgi:hypothetical protein
MYQRLTYGSSVRFAAFAGLAMVIATQALAAEGASDPQRNARLLDKLVASYPDFLASHNENALMWKDGGHGL